MSSQSAESAFAHLSAIAASLFEAPMAFVTVLEGDRQWMRAAAGLAPCDLARSDSFCTHAAERGSGAVLVVEDAALDPIFAAKSVVTGDPGIRFYAGAVITRKDGGIDGAVCVADTVARPQPTEAQLSGLRRLASLASEHIDAIDLTERLTRNEEALQQAALAAEAATASKTEFLANISHELRTPLTSIIGFVGLLQQFGTLNAQDRRFVNRIGAGGEALLAMIGDVLDYSKLEVGAVELHPEPLPVEAFLNDTMSLVGPAAGEKWLKLSVEVGAGAPELITVDRTRLRQVLMNLLSNAVKFTSEGGVTLGLAPDGPGRVRVTVTDTGIGVPDEARGRLFKRFSQVDGSTVRDYGGTGLGLAICKSLVEIMGGEIGCESVAGSGSTFWFTLPADGAAARDLLPVAA